LNSEWNLAETVIDDSVAFANATKVEREALKGEVEIYMQAE